MAEGISHFEGMMADDFAQDLLLLVNTLLSETAEDRVIAIVAASYIEKHLTDVIRKAMPGLTPALTNNLFKPDRGPLGSMSAKIDMAEALQVMQPDLAADARLIGRIRNKFAHDLAVDKFQNVKVRDLVKGLATGRDAALPPGSIDFDNDLRATFYVSAIAICVQIMHRNVSEFPYAFSGPGFIAVGDRPD